MSEWKMVPVVPTEEMHASAVRTIGRCTGNADFPPRVWRAMLDAAPTPPAPQPMTDERPLFEASVLRRHSDYETPELLLQRNYSGNYATTSIQGEWVGWQERALLAAQEGK